MLELVAAALEQRERFGEYGVESICREHLEQSATIRRRISLLIELGLVERHVGVTFRRSP